MQAFETLLNMKMGASVVLLRLLRRISMMCAMPLPEMQWFRARSHSSRSAALAV